MQGNDKESALALPAGAGPEPFARAFGVRAEDLDIDFAALPRPVAVTEVLRRSFRRGAAEIWSWTLPERSQALIAVALATGDERLECHARCPETGCAEMMEWEIALAAFPRGDENRIFDWSPEPERTLRVSVPTGEDQRAWLGSGEVTPASMAQRLVKEVDGGAPADGWQISEAWMESLAAELGRRDPLTALAIEARCPACGAAFEIEFDLEAELLKRLAARQSRTLRDIHRLASVYHWPEGEILRLPAWRRNYYLRQLEEGR